MQPWACHQLLCVLAIAAGVLSTAAGNSDYQADINYAADPDYYNDSDDDVYNETQESPGREKVSKRTPKLISTSKSLIVNKGATIKLSCDVDRLGTEDFMIMWKKGDGIIMAVGERVMNDEDKRVKVELRADGSSLIISLADEADAGDYTCQVNTVNSKILHHHVAIRVAPQVRVAEQLIEVRAGQPAKLQCEAAAGNPLPDLFWTKQGESGHGQVTKGGLLRIAATTRHHAGTYTCHGDNGWGELANATVRLNVLHAPVIEEPTDSSPSYQQAREGEEVEITCVVSAQPTPTIEWYRNGRLLPAEETVTASRGQHHTLIIPAIGGRQTFGRYECRAVNSLGEDMRLVEVGGLADPPMFLMAAAGDGDADLVAWTVHSLTPVTEFRLEYAPTSAAGIHNQGGEGTQAWKSVAVEAEPAGVDLYAGRQTLDSSLLASGIAHRIQVLSHNAFGWSKRPPTTDWPVLTLSRPRGGRTDRVQAVDGRAPDDTNLGAASSTLSASGSSSVRPSSLSSSPLSAAAASGVVSHSSGLMLCSVAMVVVVVVLQLQLPAWR